MLKSGQGYVRIKKIAEKCHWYNWAYDLIKIASEIAEEQQQNVSLPADQEIEAWLQILMQNLPADQKGNVKNLNQIIRNPEMTEEDKQIAIDQLKQIIEEYKTTWNEQQEVQYRDRLKGVILKRMRQYKKNKLLPDNYEFKIDKPLNNCSVDELLQIAAQVYEDVNEYMQRSSMLSESDKEILSLYEKNTDYIKWVERIRFDSSKEINDNSGNIIDLKRIFKFFDEHPYIDINILGQDDVNAIIIRSDYVNSCFKQYPIECQPFKDESMWAAKSSKIILSDRVKGYIESYNKNLLDSVLELEKNGVYIVALNTPGDLNYEGDVLGHCVGEYSDDVLRGYKEIYSLRINSGSMPAVTIDIEFGYKFDTSSNFSPDTKRGEVHQIRGKGNSMPINRYKPFILQWIINNNFQIINDADGALIGNVFENMIKKYEDIKNMQSIRDVDLIPDGIDRPIIDREKNFDILISQTKNSKFIGDLLDSLSEFDYKSMASLSSNPHLNEEQQDRLLNELEFYRNSTALRELCLNFGIFPSIQQKLFDRLSAENDQNLSANPIVDEKILTKIAERCFVLSTGLAMKGGMLTEKEVSEILDYNYYYYDNFRYVSNVLKQLCLNPKIPHNAQKIILNLITVDGEKGSNYFDIYEVLFSLATNRNLSEDLAFLKPVLNYSSMESLVESISSPSIAAGLQEIILPHMGFKDVIKLSRNPNLAENLNFLKPLSELSDKEIEKLELSNIKFTDKLFKYLIDTDILLPIKNDEILNVFSNKSITEDMLLYAMENKIIRIFNEFNENRLKGVYPPHRYAEGARKMLISIAKRNDLSQKIIDDICSTGDKFCISLILSSINDENYIRDRFNNGGIVDIFNLSKNPNLPKDLSFLSSYFKDCDKINATDESDLVSKIIKAIKFNPEIEKFILDNILNRYGGKNHIEGVSKEDLIIYFLKNKTISEDTCLSIFDEIKDHRHMCDFLSSRFSDDLDEENSEISKDFQMKIFKKYFQKYMEYLIDSAKRKNIPIDYLQKPPDEKSKHIVKEIIKDGEYLYGRGFDKIARYTNNEQIQKMLIESPVIDILYIENSLVGNKNLGKSLIGIKGLKDGEESGIVPDIVKEKLFKNQNYSLLATLPSISVEMFDAIYKMFLSYEIDDSLTLVSFFKNSSCPEYILEDFSKRIFDEQSHFYFDRLGHSIFRAFFSNPRLTQKIQRKVLEDYLSTDKKDKYWFVEAFRLMCENVKLIPEIKDLILKEHEHKMSVNFVGFPEIEKNMLLGLVGNPIITAEELIKIIDYNDSTLFSGILKNPNVDERVIRKVFEKSNEFLSAKTVLFNYTFSYIPYSGKYDTNKINTKVPQDIVDVLYGMSIYYNGVKNVPENAQRWLYESKDFSQLILLSRVENLLPEFNHLSQLSELPMDSISRPFYSDVRYMQDVSLELQEEILKTNDLYMIKSLIKNFEERGIIDDDNKTTLDIQILSQFLGRNVPKYGFGDNLLLIKFEGCEDYSQEPNKTALKYFLGFVKNLSFLGEYATVEHEDLVLSIYPRLFSNKTIDQNMLRQHLKSLNLIPERMADIFEKIDNEPSMAPQAVRNVDEAINNILGRGAGKSINWYVVSKNHKNFNWLKLANIAIEKMKSSKRR